jgi:hypothetical protein
MPQLIGTRRAKAFKAASEHGIPLRTAVANGIKLKIGKTDDLSKIGFILTNGSGAPATVELTGGVLLPDNDNFQRLLVAGAQGVATTSVTLETKEKRSLTLETCCMDRHLTPPTKDVTYRVADYEAPDKLVRAATRFVGSKAPVANTNRLGDREPALSLQYVQNVCWDGKE